MVERPVVNDGTVVPTTVPKLGAKARARCAEIARKKNMTSGRAELWLSPLPALRRVVACDAHIASWCGPKCRSRVRQVIDGAVRSFRIRRSIGGVFRSAV